MMGLNVDMIDLDLSDPSNESVKCYSYELYS